MNSKIKIKYGEIEVEYEGAEEFLKNDLPELLKTLADLHQPAKAVGSQSSNHVNSKPSGASGEEITLSTGSIAARNSYKSAPELDIADCAQKALVQKKGTYTREEILEQMQTANGFYKTSSRNNLTQSLNSLIKGGEILENSDKTYSLSATKLKE